MSERPTQETSQSRPSVEEMAERLLDAAAIGRFAEELALARLALDEDRIEVESPERVRYRVLFFDLALVSTTDRSVQISTAVDLLAGLSAEEWDAILLTSRIDDLSRLAGEPGASLELVELLTYAPDAGVRDFAISELEASGVRLLAIGEDTRSVERLLHAAGATDAAYRIEATRKQRAGTQLSSQPRSAQSEESIPYRVIAIAGGHAQLRAAASALLERHGVTVVPIPSSQEAVRRERDIVQSLQGCDSAMLLVRQITHSTSDQVRKAAERLGIPVIFSNAASAVAIERQLLDRGR